MDRGCQSTRCCRLFLPNDTHPTLRPDCSCAGLPMSRTPHCQESCSTNYGPNAHSHNNSWPRRPNAYGTAQCLPVPKASLPSQMLAQTWRLSGRAQSTGTVPLSWLWDRDNSCAAAGMHVIVSAVTEGAIRRLLGSCPLCGGWTSPPTHWRPTCTPGKIIRTPRQLPSPDQE